MPDPNNIVLREHGIVFMCLPRVANTAVKTALQRAVGGQGYVHDPRAFETCDKKTAWRLRARHGFTVLALVREPLARLASCWRGKVMGETLHPGFRRYPEIRQGMSFADFVEACAVESDMCAEQHFRSQSFDLCLNGELVPGWIGRHEALDKAWAAARVLMRARGLEVGKLARVNQSQAPAPEIDDETRALVRHRWAADYARFGYG